MATWGAERGELLHEGHVHALYRGRAADGAAVIRKVLEVGRRTEAAEARLRREYELLRALAEVGGVVEATAIRDEDGDLVLELRDFGGASLDAAIDDAALGIRERLTIAAELAGILGGVHAAGVIHRDIKPRNILIDGDLRVQLIDFGIATRAAAAELCAAEIQGTLAYIAPEQTGRIQRSVDHRADLYSLGVTLYELFTGRLPFVAEDPAELIHAHLARVPAAPASLRPELPAPLSAVILRLLAKSPEDRYRSAFGLAHDLVAIAAALDDGDDLEAMELGASDPPLVFQIPERLYGRADARAALEEALTRARGGAPEAVLLRGAAGSGKSALFRELRRDHLGEGARFAAGAYDPSSRGVPYAALFDALAQPLRELLGEGEEVEARWRWSLGRSLAGLASALTPRLPELARLLGVEPPTDEGERFSTDAARNRLHRALHVLVRALGRRQAPLVLFLDDLQWVDDASLDLLVDLVGETAGEGLFCVLAGDLGDDREAPAIAAALRRLGQRARLTTIELAPLEADAIAAMIGDSLGLPAAAVGDLAEVVARKSGGSGFFAAELLRDLERAGIIRFDARARTWRYDLDAAVAAAVTRNVVELLLSRVAGLERAEVELLQRGACLGMSFSAASFEPALGGEAGDAAALAERLAAARERRLVEVRRGQITFTHERVREAILATLEPAERAALHLAIARQRAATIGPEASDAAVFIAADHYEAAAAVVADADERLLAARLCLTAAQRARRGAALEAAIARSDAGLVFLGASPWRVDYPLTYALMLLRNECEAALGQLERADATTAVLLREALSAEDRAEVLVTRAGVHNARNELERVVETAAEAVSLLGEELPTRPSMPALVLGMIRVGRALGGRQPRELLELPELRTRRDRLLLQAYAGASAAAFQGDPKLLTQIALKMIEVGLRAGLNASIAQAFITYGLAVGAGRRDYAMMEGFGRAGIELVKRYPEPGAAALCRFLYFGMVAPMSHPYSDCAGELREAVRRGVEAGAAIPAGLAAMAGVTMAIAAGGDLERLEAEAVAALELAASAKIGSPEWIVRINLGFARALRSGAEVPRLGNADLDEAVVDNPGDARVAPTSHYAYLHRRLYLSLVLGELDDAVAVITRVDPNVKAVFGLFSAYYDYRGLRALVLAGRAQRADRRLRRELRATLRELAAPAARVPANFAALRELVGAELARLRGRDDAAERYERALKAAARAGNHLHEGLAGERAGRYFLGRGLDSAARAYLVRARRAFARARALAKLRRLDAEFPGLDRRPVAAPPPTMADVSITLTAESTPSSASSSSSRGDHLVDLASVIKAAQAFAAELELDALSARMMRIVVENAGAERGVLLLVEDGGLVVATEYSARDDRLTDHGRAPLDGVGGIPQGLVLRVSRSGRAEVFDDAASDPVNAGDSYIQRRRLRSALALPLVARGRGVGVVYLENNLAAGVFTVERLDVLQLLAVQAAIAVDHAAFFARLDAARDAAEAANLAKSRFLANMSHELRTPLNAVLGYAELIAEDAEEAGLTSVVDDVAKIRGAGQHLLGLVSEILDLTKVEAGALELTRATIVVGQLLDGVCDVVRAEVEAGGNALVRDDRGDLGTIVGDPLRIRQLLVNLLSNAGKFTEAGVVTLRSRRDGEAIEFAVIDTGIGIDAAELARIFEPFTQVDPTSTRRYGGAGLGLTICRRLSEQMGGELAVRSEPGVGSTFTLRLPAEPS